jgi:hypothetical protein
LDLGLGGERQTKKTEWRGGERLVLAPGGAMLIRSARNSGASGTRIACEERLAKGGLGNNGPYRSGGWCPN